MSGQLQLTPEELQIVRDILTRCLPPGYRSFVFGSRATGVRLKPWSDLDLSIEGPAPLSFQVLGRLRHEFDEALLQWKVDVVDRCSVSETFGGIIDSHKVPLELGDDAGT